MEQKTCTRCGIQQPVNEFAINPRGKRVSRCYSCMREIAKEIYYRKNLDKILEKENRWLKIYTPKLSDEQKREEKEKKFWSCVDIRSIDECWEWNKCKLPSGYGHTRFNGKSETAHRISYIYTFGDIPDGLCICHICNNPSCCNPNHLYAGTMKQNVKDREQRYAKGELVRVNYQNNHHHPRHIDQDNNVLGYIGVSKSYDGYNAFIARFRGKYIGYSKDIIEAAKMYDKAAIDYYGENAYLNFQKRLNG